MAFTFKSGWKYDQEKIAAAEERMVAAGCQINFGAARPDFKGHWKYLQSRGIAGIFAQDDELKVLGHYRDPNCQYRGTCVEQGSGRGCEDTHISRIADGLIVGEYTLLAGEAAYGYMRNKFWTQTHKWGCQCGDCPDGMMGADFAEFAAVKGMIARGVYQDIDLTKPREDLAILWNNTGVPQHIIEAGADHKFLFHNSSSWDEYADATAAKNFGAICLPKVFYGTQRDKNGCCMPDGDGGHCTECCGVFLLPDGTTAFVIQQSWPLNAVHYPEVVMTINGPKRLRPGSYAVRMDVLGDISSRYRDQIERWSSDCPPKSSFRKALAV